jgi:hypothetical protein
MEQKAGVVEVEIPDAVENMEPLEVENVPLVLAPGSK